MCWLTTSPALSWFSPPHFQLGWSCPHCRVGWWHGCSLSTGSSTSWMSLSRATLADMANLTSNGWVEQKKPKKSLKYRPKYFLMYFPNIILHNANGKALTEHFINMSRLEQQSLYKLTSLKTLQAIIPLPHNNFIYVLGIFGLQQHNRKCTWYIRHCHHLRVKHNFLGLNMFQNT